MSVPRLGVAKAILSISDADGFRVVHGSDNVTLVHVPPEKLNGNEWGAIWRVIDSIKAKGA